MTCNGDCQQGRSCNCECKKETKMTKQTEALRMAIEFIEDNVQADQYDWLIQACKDALAETQEDIGEMKENGVTWYKQNPHAYPVGTKFYATPPSREWVGLSDRELFNLSQQCDLNHILGLIDYGRAVEQALREKNNG